MKKYLIFTLLVLFVIGCKSTKNVVDNNVQTNNNSILEKRYETIYNLRDSLVIKDSVVVREDGSVVYREKSSNRVSIDRKNTFTYYYLNINKNIVKTQKETIFRTKKIFVRDAIWYSGLMFYICLFIIILNKLNKKFSLWKRLTKGL